MRTTPTQRWQRLTTPGRFFERDVAIRGLLLALMLLVGVRTHSVFASEIGEQRGALGGTAPPGRGDSDDIRVPRLVTERGVSVWRGPADEIRVETIAAMLSPVLWFSPDEVGRHLAEPLSMPHRLPCDVSSDGPVVYYRLAPNRVAIGYEQTIEYFFYYPYDLGTSCHANDLESVEMQFSTSVEPNGGVELVLRTIIGRAHGSRLLANELDLSARHRDRGHSLASFTLPVTLLVEENKHATAPDRNGDGVFSPGFDVNRSVSDAWGVRDSFGSGFFVSPVYQSWMTKPRARNDRVPPCTLESADLQLPLEKRARSCYVLRPIPAACVARIWIAEPKVEGCRRLPLATLFDQNHIGAKSSNAFLDGVKDALKEFATGTEAVAWWGTSGRGAWGSASSEFLTTHASHTSRAG